MTTRASEHPDRRPEAKPPATAGTRAWTIVEAVVLTFAIAALAVTLLHFFASGWLG